MLADAFDNLLCSWHKSPGPSTAIHNLVGFNFVHNNAFMLRPDKQIDLRNKLRPAVATMDTVDTIIV